MSALSGGKPRAKANGSNIATPLIGPRPGNMPTIVPKKAPISASSKFFGVDATAKPCIKKSKVSILAILLSLTTIRVVI